MTGPTDRDLAAALAAVRHAAVVARAVQDDLDELREITKDDRSPVTVADFAVQAIVSLALREALGDVRLVGEEHADQIRGDEHAAIRATVVEAVRSYAPEAAEPAILAAIDRGDHDGSARSFWTLDPVDGTKGFLRGQQYAIALARIDEGEVTAGVMGCPALPADADVPIDARDPRGSLYAAVRHGGAWAFDAADADADPRPIEAAGRAPDAPIRLCESVEAGHSRHDDVQAVADRLGHPVESVRIDSQCKYALVARGQADVYLRMPTRTGYVEKIWDHAAGALLATEAGAVVTDVSGAALDFTHGRRLEANRGIVCATAGLHEEIIRAIADLGIAAPA